MRPVKLTVGGTSNGVGKTWAYPNGKLLGFFQIPTYSCTVSGRRSDGVMVRQVFNVFRFGVQSLDGKTASVVGLAKLQTHTIKAWIPTYTVHSYVSPEEGAWQVYDNFLVHDGPDDSKEVAATIGCIEVMGPLAFVKFNDLIISLAGPSASSRDRQLLEIGDSRKLTITYQAATRPSLKRWS
jgi:hypothetical protein